MVTILERMQQDVVSAMKAGDKQRTAALRIVVAELQRNAKEGDGDEIAVLQRQRKQRLESAEAFRSGGREEMAIGEESEAEMIKAYLPEQMPEDELRKLIGDAIAQQNAQTPRDIGKVMSAVMPQVKGRADGSTISTLVKELLPG